MSAHVAKIKTFFFIFVALNIVVVLYLYSSELKIFFTSYSSVQPNLSKKVIGEDLTQEVYDVQSIDNQYQDYQWLLGGEKEEVNYLYLRTVGVPNSTEELDYLLNIRKLILFAVHELNKPLKYTGCTKWWANPLDLVYHNTTLISTTHIDHSIKFRIQPGNVKAAVKVRQQKPPIRLDDRELEFLGRVKLIKFQGERCDGERLTKVAKRVCLCAGSIQFNVFNNITTDLRTKWNETDREAVTWPVDRSFIITDYMNFTDYEWFVTSPGNTIEEVAEIGYSTEFCGPNIKMLVMVSSAPSHFIPRKTIRETYASNLEGKGIKVVFLFGVSTDAKVNDDVKGEAEKTKDIIQANYVDAYHNMTLSHLSMYKWAHLTCIGGRKNGVTVPQSILKADDDFFLRIDLALQVAQQNLEYEFIGLPYCNAAVVRDVGSMWKYYTPRYMHLSNTYGGYLAGNAFIVRTDVIPLLWHMSITTPIVHMDDVYIGLLLRQVNIQARHSALFLYYHIDPDACESKKVVSSFVDLDGVSDMTAEWNAFLQPMPSNCTLKDLKVKVWELTDEYRRICLYNRTATTAN